MIGLNSTPNTLSSTGGIVLAGKIFSAIEFSTAEPETLPEKYRYVLNTLAGLQLQGRTRFAEVEHFRNDVLFKKALDLSMVYSPETLRLYLEQGAGRYKKQMQSHLDTVHLNLLQKATFTPIETNYGSYIPVDIDVSPFDNSIPIKRESVVLIKVMMALLLFLATSAKKDLCLIRNCGRENSTVRMVLRNIYRGTLTN